MANIAKINVNGLDYNVKDSDAREHVLDQNNPHKVSAEQVGLGQFLNESPESILQKVDRNFIADGIGYTPANQEDLENKLDKNAEQPQEVKPLVKFVNGVQINGASITYNSITDTVVFK